MSVTFPGESVAYRQARDELLGAEIALRRQIEEVAAQRRRLPIGGPVAEDYVFDEIVVDGDGVEQARAVRLSELFEEGTDTLLLYSYMFGPAMPTPCTSCTSILDGLDGTAPHARQRVAFAVVARSPIERVRGIARARGWRNLRLLSSSRNTYHPDYHGENAAGAQLPIMNVFVRREGRVHHFYATELLFAAADPGQDSRHVDLIWPLWNLFDLIPEGRGTTWNPKLTYADPLVGVRRG